MPFQAQNVSLQWDYLTSPSRKKNGIKKIPKYTGIHPKEHINPNIGPSIEVPRWQHQTTCILILGTCLGTCWELGEPIGNLMGTHYEQKFQNNPTPFL